jgi:hypothetical protein
MNLAQRKHEKVFRLFLDRPEKAWLLLRRRCPLLDCAAKANILYRKRRIYFVHRLHPRFGPSQSARQIVLSLYARRDRGRSSSRFPHGKGWPAPTRSAQGPP